ncbi:MAG: hypothetical protein ABIK54_07820 [candidate division WOR-3 bacterium]
MFASWKALIVATAFSVTVIGIAFADDNPDSEGLWLFTMQNGMCANRCSVVAYVSIITTNEPAARYAAGYTGPGGLCDFPPYYWRCKFSRFGPNGSYYIPRDSRYRWRFYAKRQDQLTQRWYYSDWSKEMEYSEDRLFDADTLNIYRDRPPEPIPPFSSEE